MRAIPGDPAIALGAEDRDPALIAQIRHKYLLDRPLPVQYAHWVWLALHGDLGVDQRELPVAHTIVSRLPISLELAVLSLVVSILIGIPAGVIAAVRRGRPEDYLATTGALIGLSVPHFWLGLLFIIWFAVDLHWLPASGYVSMSHPIAKPRAHGDAGDRARHRLRRGANAPDALVDAVDRSVPTTSEPLGRKA